METRYLFTGSTDKCAHICQNCKYYQYQPHTPRFESWADDDDLISGYCSSNEYDDEVNYDWHCAAFEEVQRND